MDTETKNPSLVLDQVVDADTNPISTVKVYPMTIRRYALLEKLDSPFIGGDKTFNVESTIPAAYIICSPKEKLRKYMSTDLSTLVEDAFDWSENLQLEDLPKMIEHLVKQLTDMNKAAPDAAAPKKN